jgi:hypothetical protein
MKLLASIILLSSTLGHAGGPQYVAGSTYFDPAVQGTALAWPEGVLNYSTDRGDLSPVVPGAAADSLVATAVSRWTSIPTAAVSATRAGQLAEDVSSANVTTVGGAVSLPADILPSAVSTPVAIVYDADGKVTDALLGTGAGSSANCFGNSVFGGVDNYGTDGHFLHALIVINGNCAQTSAQVPDLQYHLVRMFGRLLGLGWSQANVNVFTRNPVPAADDFNGLPLMHATDPISCVPISLCYPNADVPKTDDSSVLTYLYPVTPANLASFPGKQITADNTARIHGSVFFTDSTGAATQPMQGVNVVARLIDPSSGKASRSVVASSVSGFLFSGNAGNPATGFSDSSGQLLTRFGGNDTSVQGFFDFAGLEIPDGSNAAQFQISVEPIDPNWSQFVGPYSPNQVQPSGAFTPVIVTVARGANVQQDVPMENSALVTQDPFPASTYNSPVGLPPSGDWTASLSGYGDGDYFTFPAKANHTLSVEAVALDASLSPIDGKAQPVVGMWALEDPGTFPAPANTPLAFNTQNFGLSRLDARILTTTNFRVGIFDYRGDGRPDYLYRARVFYADAVSVSRASAGGGTPFSITGIGFHRNTVCAFGSTTAAVLAVSASRLITATPPARDGIRDVTLSDPASGSSSTISSAVTFGAAASDGLKLISGAGPATPIGSLALNPFKVQVIAADGSTPVPGASVMLNATPAVAFSACAGSSTCTILSDDNGSVSTRVKLIAAGNNTLTAFLAPASYPSPKSVQLTLLGSSSSLAISLDNQQLWVAQGATVDIPLSARVLSNGVPVSSRTVEFQVLQGTASLAAPASVSDLSGIASNSVHLANLGGGVLISACVMPGNVPCQNFSVTAVPASTQSLQAVSGTRQALASGQTLRPVVVRVTDVTSPPHPVIGATVAVQDIVSRIDPASDPLNIGGILIGRNPAPVVITSSRFAMISDNNGQIAIVLSPGNASGSVQIQGTASAGVGVIGFNLQSFAQ